MMLKRFSRNGAVVGCSSVMAVTRPFKGARRGEGEGMIGVLTNPKTVLNHVLGAYRRRGLGPR